MTSAELKAARKRLRLTQKELGKELGLTADFISKMERGEKEIATRTELAVRALENTGGTMYTYEAIYYVSEFKNESFETADLGEIIKFSRDKANETRMPVHVMEIDEETGMDREVMLVGPAPADKLAG